MAVVNFATIMHMRTGSTYLMEALDSHPSITAVGEIFKHYGEKSNRDRLEQQLLEIKQFWDDTEGTSSGARGFKIKWLHLLDPAGFAHLLKDEQARVICLRRWNVVRQAISHFRALELAAKSGRWNVYEGIRGLGPIHIDPDRFHEKVRAFDRRNHEMAAYAVDLEVPTLLVSYEDLLMRHDRTMELLQGFLGVPSKPLQGDTKKHTSDDLREAVANIDQLAARMDGTLYARMFDQPG